MGEAMACRKAFDVDLVACLLDAGRPEWTEFREHYPRCPECAAEVRTWTELQSSLAPPHPETGETPVLHWARRSLWNCQNPHCARRCK